MASSHRDPAGPRQARDQSGGDPVEEGVDPEPGRSSEQVARAFDRGPSRRIWLLAGPQFFALAIEPIAGLIDASFLADRGDAAGAALGLGLVVMPAVLWICNFLGVCGHTEVARALGRGDRSSVQRITMTTMALGAVLGAVLGGILLVLAPSISRWSGLDAAAVQLAVDYLRIRALSAPAVIVLLGVAGVLRGLHDMRSPVAASVLIGFVNVGLDWWLIPRLGLSGAAIATTSAQWLGAVLLVVVAIRRVGFGRPDRGALPSLLRAGGDVVARTALLHVFLVQATSQANDLGEEFAAGHNVVRQVWLLTAMLLDAFAFATQSLVGTFLGAADLGRASRAAVVGMKQAALFGLGLAVLLGFSGQLAQDVFATDQETLLGGDVFLAAFWVMAISQPMNAIAFASDGVLWAEKRYAYLRNAMFLATAAGVLSLWAVDSLTGIWVAISVWILVRALAGGFGILSLVRRARDTEDR